MILHPAEIFIERNPNAVRRGLVTDEERKLEWRLKDSKNGIQTFSVITSNNCWVKPVLCCNVQHVNVTCKLKVDKCALVPFTVTGVEMCLVQTPSGSGRGKGRAIAVMWFQHHPVVKLLNVSSNLNQNHNYMQDSVCRPQASNILWWMQKCIV